MHSTVCPFSNCRGNLKRDKTVRIPIDRSLDARLNTPYNFYVDLRLHLSGFPSYVTDSVLPSHSSAVCYFNLKSFNFFRKFNPLRICQRFSLLVDISDVQYLAHEFDNRLCLVESRRGHCKISINNLESRFDEFLISYFPHRRY